MFHILVYLTQWQHCRDVAVTYPRNTIICDVAIEIALSNITVVVVIRDLCAHSLRCRKSKILRLIY
jgi:hypothetical protein